MCSTNSFGLVPKDLSVNNAIVKDTLVVCGRITTHDLHATRLNGQVIPVPPFSNNGGSGTNTLTTPVPLSRTFYVDGTNVSTSSPNGSIERPFTTIQAALDFIGPATTAAEFRDPTKFAWQLIIGPGQYIEDISIPIRADWTFVVNGVVIVGNVTFTCDWDIYRATGEISQVKLKFVGGDLRSAFQPQSGPPTQIMAINGISGNLVLVPKASAGPAQLFIQVHFINFGVTGTPGVSATPPTGTGHIMALESPDLGSTSYVTQVFFENALLTGDFFVGTSVASPSLQGTLYAANTDTSSTASNGGCRGRISLNVLRSARFTRPCVITGVPGRWIDTEFAANNDFTGATGTCQSDYNSFQSFMTTTPTLTGAVVFTILDRLSGTTAQRPTAKLPLPANNGALYFDTTLGIPIWRFSTGWVNATGTVV